jgi:hypothetical protein
VDSEIGHQIEHIYYLNLGGGRWAVGREDGGRWPVTGGSGAAGGAAAVGEWRVIAT